MRWLFWWRPPCLLRAVIINLTDGNAIQGVLWSSRGPWLTVRESKLLVPNANATVIDGEAVLHRDRVTFIQVLP